jgi:putative addiction module component (TIGR02574 family)
MTARLLRSALKLPKAQRILLAQALWDSLAWDQDAPELSQTQKAELERRLARLRTTGTLGSTWSDVKARATRATASTPVGPSSSA